jgi:hypothetical protein
MDWLSPPALLLDGGARGGLVPAGKLLRLAHPTLSAQVHALEDQLGESFS